MIIYRHSFVRDLLPKAFWYQASHCDCAFYKRMFQFEKSPHTTKLTYISNGFMPNVSQLFLIYLLNQMYQNQK